MTENRRMGAGMFFCGLLIGIMMAAQGTAWASDGTDPCSAVSSSGTEATSSASEETAASAPNAGDLDETTVEETAATQDFAVLRLTEIFPNPIGDDEDAEFLELENMGEIAADLDGWKLVDQKNRSFTFPAETLAARAVTAFSYDRTHLMLVNSGGTVTLLRPDGTVADAVTYGTAPEGKSYARDAAGVWAWNRLPTPGRTNDPDGFRTTSTAGSSGSSTSSSSGATTDKPETTPVADPAVTILPFETSAVIVEAFLPRPNSGDSEWIEITNTGAVTAALKGWKLDDAEGGSRAYALDGITLAAGETLRLNQAQTKLGLNDDGDTVRLLGPDGTVTFSTTYVKAPAGQARLLIEGTWRWENESTASETTTAEQDSTPMPTLAPATDAGAEEALATEQAVTLAATADGKKMMEATVTLPPGKVGSNTFAIVTDEGTGMFIRAYGSGLPKIRRGSRLFLPVKTSSAAGVTTGTTTSSKVTVIGQDDDESAEPATDLASANGRIVLLNGTVTAGGKRWLTLTPDGQEQEVKVVLLSGEMPTGKQEGVTAEVTGVLRIRAGKAEILAEAEDLQLTQATPPAVTEADSAAATVPAPANSGGTAKTAKNVTAIATPIGGVAASIYALWRRRRGVTDIPT